MGTSTYIRGMSDGLESVLRRVAAGELTPEEALAQLGAPAPAPEPGAPASTGSTPEYGTDEPVTTIRLKSSYRSVQLIADPTVTRVHVIGDHAIRHEGPALVVSTAGPLDDDEHESGDDRSHSGSGRFSFSDLPR